MDKKPGLAILIGEALAKKKGKAPEMESEESEYGSEEEGDARMQEIADEMMDAIHSKDSMALKELLEEAIECHMSMK